MATRPDPEKQYARRSSASTAPSMADAFRPTDHEATRHLGARIPDSLHREMRRYLAEHDITVQDFVRSAVINELGRSRQP